MRISNMLSAVGLLLCAACSSSGTESGQPAQASQANAGTSANANGGSAGGPGTPAAEGGRAAPKPGAANGGSAASAANGTSGASANGASSKPVSSGSAGAAGSASSSTGSAAGSGGGVASAAAGAAGGGAAAGSMAAATTEKFSFFVTSLQGMRELSKNEQGFGGDLRYGEKTGLEGADKICRELAEQSMPGAGAKGWHAFLSAAKSGPNGAPVHAKDRIGKGPWYDRLGRLVAMNVGDLLNDRPKGADSAIGDDLPNERGEPNHTDTREDMDDNHDTVTATAASGMWDGNMTCDDWTSTETPMPPMDNEDPPQGGWFMFDANGPGLGHSWPSEQSGTSWIQVHRAPGCSPSVALVQMGGGMGTGIGNAGGYGGIYCFASQP